MVDVGTELHSGNNVIWVFFLSWWILAKQWAFASSLYCCPDRRCLCVHFIIVFIDSWQDEGKRFHFCISIWIWTINILTSQSSPIVSGKHARYSYRIKSVVCKNEKNTQIKFHMSRRWPDVNGSWDESVILRNVHPCDWLPLSKKLNLYWWWRFQWTVG